MSDTESSVCPVCGRAADPEASFCEVCGAELHAKVAEVESHAEFAEVAEGKSHAQFAKVAEGKSHAEVAEVAEEVGAVPPPLVHAKPAASVRPTEPASAGFGPSAAIPLRANPAEVVSFELEWDEARSFIEGRAGQLAFRFKPLCNLAKAGVRAVVNGANAGVQVFSAMQAGRVREGLFDITPDRPGTLSVQLRVETLLDSGTHETFEAERCLEHEVYPATRLDVRGAGSLTINVSNNTGIVRNDDMNLSVLRGAQSDRWEDQRRVLGRRGSFARIGFAPVSVVHENARFLGTGAALDELLVVPGSDTVSFGRSARRADVILASETPDGESDPMRSDFVSGVHFSIRRDRSCETFSIFDGGPSDHDSRGWSKSTNGLAVDGKLENAPRSLAAGRRFSVTLAPYAVAGGALPLELETRGWDDPAASGCASRVGNLSSVLVRRLDNPRKAVLVVWGAAALDPVLGTKSGQRVASLDGRLFLVDRHGEATSIHRLAGRALPGTPFTIS